ncbi:hypothetical protein EJ04DRAFT_162165 [Polyplosphaeria fusca]|uniref:MutL C-terminal dimerisation domain-containing protein n=1 Tax=Polyplosphaeria fusca TaxID=682080 RepID=A0A9P4RCP2_9PLEO|nr:hypothetical protein EJ04DRAFT_162165 [Polyplosphaeria fusca]
MPDPAGGAIRPLPDDVAAQIKSSVAITSLVAVVLELIHNALDAHATQIDATVDFARGSCSVQDNGLGIAPLEFTEAGGLGKLHHTSKYSSHEACLGQDGTFLASLAAMSLLTITSHHHGHRSHNSITFHHSKPINRQLPALSQHEISHHKHGTRATVRNLFGNLPVRVKHRSVAVQEKAESGRLWEALRKEITGTLLSWEKVVSVKVRDSQNKVAMKCNSQAADTGLSPKPHSSSLDAMLHILTQTNYITIDDWASWVPVSASTSSISIRGAICLDPAPSKRIQFFSFGVRFLPSDSGHNELYDQVNRIFDRSSFGTVEDGLDEDEKVRRESDKRYKNNSFTNRQLRGQKGVDRFPMFHLRVSLRDATVSNAAGKNYFDDEVHLQAVIEVLNVMITQWLETHHFRPLKQRKQRTLPEKPTTTSASEEDVGMMQLPHVSTTCGRNEGLPAVAFSRAKSTPISAKKRRPVSTSSKIGPERLQQPPFPEWSRIKSGKAQFYDKIWASDQPVRDVEADNPSLGIPVSEQLDSEDASSRGTDIIRSPDVLPEAPNTSVYCTNAEDHVDCTDSTATGDNNPPGNCIIWTNPSTRQTFLLDVRTGAIIPRSVPRPLHPAHDSTIAGSLTEFNKPVRLPQHTNLSNGDKSSWINGFLESWDNPVFAPVERSIPQTTVEWHQCRNTASSGAEGLKNLHIDTDKIFREASAPSSSKLSKQGLREAEVVAQLDKKFILVKMHTFARPWPNPDSDSDVLILIDQHAADERIRVEALLSELCQPPPAAQSQTQHCSKLGQRSKVVCSILEKPILFSVSAQEREHFISYAARFSAWGILYDVLTSMPPKKVQSTLSVSTLPPAISERCRSDPKLLISFLRAAVWTYVDEAGFLPLPWAAPDLVAGEEADSPSWLKQLSTCPQGLVDMINSRACRSAIMFNDELSVDECRALVKQLSSCVFPFMCAHGRPSMIPLVNLGTSGLAIDSGESSGLTPTDPEPCTQSFVDAWRKWKLSPTP